MHVCCCRVDRFLFLNTTDPTANRRKTYFVLFAPWTWVSDGSKPAGQPKAETFLKLEHIVLNLKHYERNRSKLFFMVSRYTGRVSAI